MQFHDSNKKDAKYETENHIFIIHYSILFQHSFIFYSSHNDCDQWSTWRQSSDQLCLPHHLPRRFGSVDLRIFWIVWRRTTQNFMLNRNFILNFYKFLKFKQIELVSTVNDLNFSHLRFAERNPATANQD